jgi:nucleolar protein 6
MINVELTAGGGGKSEKRMEKLRERNKVLLGQRVSVSFINMVHSSV